MITQIQKWGNSLAVRIPKALAADLDLEQNSTVEIREEQGRLVLVPIKKAEFTLEQLLAQVSPENLHTEIESGPALGNEAW